MAKYNLNNYLERDGLGFPLNFRRGNPNPLDNSSVWSSLGAAQNYAQNDPTAYVGQIISVVNYTPAANGTTSKSNVTVYYIKDEAGTLVKLGDGGTATITPDGKSVIFDNDVLKLVGFDTATAGQIPQKSAEGQLIWNNIALRRDNDYNYKKIENTFIPIKGEVCFVDVAGYGLRAKVGDGINPFALLPYTDEAINNLIVKGYYYQQQFYANAEHTILLENKIGCIYIDAATSKIYTFNGFDYITQGNNLPNATAQTAGIMKLYNTKGQNIDGTMTQQAITNELNEKFEMDVVKEEEMIIFSTDID